MDDTPIYWNKETGEIIEDAGQELVIPEEPPVPTIEEQHSIVDASITSPESKNMLNSLIEMNSIAQTLAVIQTNETIEQRRTVLNAWCESFVNARMQNNAAAETLKAKLLNRLLDNIDELDLETTAKIYNDLTEVSSVDAQNAMSNISGGDMGSNSVGSGINLTINNATAEGSAITNNTLNAQPQQIQQLKETATLNQSLKAWNNVPLPKKKIIEIEQ